MRTKAEKTSAVTLIAGLALNIFSLITSVQLSWLIVEYLLAKRELTALYICMVIYLVFQIITFITAAMTTINLLLHAKREENNSTTMTMIVFGFVYCAFGVLFKVTGTFNQLYI